MIENVYILAFIWCHCLLRQTWDNLWPLLQIFAQFCDIKIAITWKPLGHFILFYIVGLLKTCSIISELLYHFRIAAEKEEIKNHLKSPIVSFLYFISLAVWSSDMSMFITLHINVSLWFHCGFTVVSLWFHCGFHCGFHLGFHCGFHRGFHRGFTVVFTVVSLVPVFGKRSAFLLGLGKGISFLSESLYKYGGDTRWVV